MTAGNRNFNNNNKQQHNKRKESQQRQEVETNMMEKGKCKQKKQCPAFIEQQKVLRNEHKSQVNAACSICVQCEMICYNKHSR